MKLSTLFKKYERLKIVFIDFTLLKKGPYVTLYPGPHVYTIHRFFKFFDDKEIAIDKVDDGIIYTIYVNDTLL